MIAVSVPVVGFEQAAAALRRLKLPSLGDSFDGLAVALSALRAVEILDGLDPDRLDGLAITGAWLVDSEAMGTACDQAMEAIDAIAPLNEMWREVDEDYTRLVPAEMGYPMNWDEWAEMCAEPDEYLEDEASLWAFCAALSQGDDEAFESFSDRFGWGVHYPEKNRRDNYLDHEKMFRGLERAGLGDFKYAWQIAWYDTGNLYFDYNIYDDNKPLPPFTLAGARQLQAEYLAALPIRQAFNLARLEFEADPQGMARRLLRFYTRNLVQRESRPQTLAEMFAAENLHTDPFGVLAGDDEDNEPLIDPFYGPLGAEEEDDGYLDDDL